MDGRPRHREAGTSRKVAGGGKRTKPTILVGGHRKELVLERARDGAAEPAAAACHRPATGVSCPDLSRARGNERSATAAAATAAAAAAAASKTAA